MRKQCGLLLALAVAAGLLGLQACGGGGVTTPGLTVTISPPSANVPVNQTADFTAKVTNATNTNVTWEVNGMPGGSSSTGTIAPEPGNNNIGVYTAPTMLPVPPTVTITAVSQQDNTTRSNPATVTITASGAGVSVSPNPADVPAGGTQSFTASVNGQATTAAWSVSCKAPQTSACGTIDAASGSYTAPLSPPTGGTVTITATTASGSGAATATIQFSGASFNGQYAFTFTGSDQNGAPLDVAGSFTTTGSASSTTVNVGSGVMDINSGSLGVITGSPITSGTFNIGAADGRSSGTITTAAGALTFKLQFTLISNQHALLVDFDTSDTGSGTIDLQNQTEFLVSKISGNYAFGVAGADAIGLNLNVAGKFFADGSGGIPGGSNQAVLDINDGGTITQADTSLSGSYGSGGIGMTTGRGIVQLTSNGLGTLTFAFYIVDHTHLKVVEIDAPPSPILDGDFFSAPATSPGAYTLATLAKGSYAFTVGGSNRGSRSIEPFVQGGVFDSDGDGNITGGIMDVNDTHNQTTHSVQPSTYTVDPTFGRIALVISNGNPFNFAAYTTSAGSAELIGLNGNPVSSGLAYLQAASGATLQGSFALNIIGVAFSGGVSFEQDTVGQIALAGTSATGNLDINSALDGIPPATFALANSPLSAPDANGRGTTTLQISSTSRFNLAYYVVNNSTLLLLDLDSNRVAVGVVGRQF
jgi:hypothetical protein